MDCDFYKDDNDKIWFFHAEDILSRPCIKGKKDQILEEKVRLEKMREFEKKAERRRKEKEE